jgi:hypothetical protein
MAAVMFGFAFSTNTLAQTLVMEALPDTTEEERRIDYMTNALEDCDEFQVGVYRLSGNSWWSTTNVTSTFQSGQAEVVIPITNTGTNMFYGYYLDRWGYSLFYSSSRVKVIDESKTYYVDLPMYPSSWRVIELNFNNTGVSTSDEIWVDGYRVYYDSERHTWLAWILEPWNERDINIIWVGHGRWTLSINQDFDYDTYVKVVYLQFDSTFTTPWQVVGFSYIGENSYAQYEMIDVENISWDSRYGCYSMECELEDSQDQELVVVVSLEQYDQSIYNYVGYYDAIVEVPAGEDDFEIPLFNTCIKERTLIRFIYFDPEEQVWKQQYNWDYYEDEEETTSSSSSGGGGGGSSGE